MDAPVITPGYSIFDSAPQTVTITATPGATIHFTVDGTVPDGSSPTYGSAFDISTTTTVRAICTDGTDWSDVTTVVIMIDTQSASVARTGLITWLRSDVGVSTVSSSVDSWKDVSGSGNDATQNSASNRPTLISNAINGLPAVSFSGSGQWLSLPSGYANFTSGITVLMIVKPTGLSTNDARILDIGPGGWQGQSISVNQPNTSQFAFSQWSSAGIQSAVLSPLPLNTYHLIEARQDSNVGTSFTDSVQGGINIGMLPIDNVTRSSNYIGRYSGSAGWYYLGEITEILIYSRALSDAERRGIELYASARYGIACVPAPQISPNVGVFDEPVMVSISFDDPSFDLFYTDDGSEPTPSSTPYTAAFSVGVTKLIQAIAAHSDGRTSHIATQRILIDPSSSPIHDAEPLVWLRSDEGVLTSGSGIYQWTDLSGNGMHATQSTVSRQPTYPINDSVGAPVVSFNGNEQWLQFPSGFADFTNGLSLFLLFMPTGLTQQDARIVDFGNGSNLLGSILVAQSTLGLLVFNVVNTSSVATGIVANYSQNAFQLLEVISDGNTIAEIFFNGSARGYNGSMTPIPNVTRTGCYIGRYTGSNGWFFKGEIVELILVDSLVAAQMRQDIEAYFFERYKIIAPKPGAPVLTLPSGTLFKPGYLAICGSHKGTVYFTNDGTLATPESGIEYTRPIRISYSQTISAIQVVDGISSDAVSASYVLDPVVYPSPDHDDAQAPAVSLNVPSPGQ